MTPRKILLVYPRFPLSYWGFQYALKLLGKRAMHPPLGLITVAAMCPQSWEYRLVDLNIEPLTDAQILWADAVFFTAMAIQHESLVDVIARCKALGRKTVLGGPFASGSPERLQGTADCIVMGEAEVLIDALVEDLARDALKPVYRTDAMPAVTRTPVPRFDLLKLSAYSVIDIQFSRGCPFNCEFCDIIELYGRVPRAKTPDQILAELQSLHDLGYRGPIFLVDDNFIGNKKAVRGLLERMIPWMEERDYPFFLTTEASINLADDRPLLESMRRAGFKRVFIGIETPSIESLRATQKHQNTRNDMVEGVHAVIEHGMEVMAGFIVGFDGDAPDIFERQIEFIQRAEIAWAMVGTLTAIPNTQLWARLEREGRLVGYAGGDQFGRPNFRTTMDPDRLLAGYLRILRTVYSPENYYARVLAMLARQDRAALPNLHAKNTPMFKVITLALTSAIALGVVAPYRKEFWKYIWKVLTRYPRQLVPALINAVIGHHFIRYTAEIMQRETPGASRPVVRPLVAPVAIPEPIAVPVPIPGSTAVAPPPKLDAEV